MKQILFFCTFFIFFQAKSQTGLWASYPFNGNVNDISGNGNNGTLMNNPTLTNDRFGTPNSAYYFNGSNYIDLGTNFNSTTFSISAWTNLDSGTTDIQEIVSRLNNGPYDFQSFELSSNALGIGDGSNWYGCYNTVVNNDPLKWYHWVATYNSGTDSAKLFINDTLGGTIIVSLANVNNIPMYIGARPYWSGVSGVAFFYHGIIDDVNVYDKELSKSEIDSLFNDGIVSTKIENKIADSDIKIYPNPSNGNLFLSCSNFINEVVVTDILGKEILTIKPNSKNLNLQINNLGIYFINVRTNKGNTTKKIIVANGIVK